MNCPRLVVGDGNLGIWGALSNVNGESYRFKESLRRKEKA